MKKTLTSAAVAVLAFAGPAVASQVALSDCAPTGAALGLCAILGGATQGSTSTFDGSIVIEGGGTPVVYDVGGGNLLGLVGLVDAEIDDILSFSTLSGLATSGTLIDWYSGPSDNLSGDGGQFSEIVGNLTVDGLDRDDDGRVFNAFYVEFDGSAPLVFEGTATLGNSVTAEGNPLAPIPLPAAGWMLLAGIGGLAAMARRRKAA
jgi:hypothetical protein